ncbi:unnamed protein product [Closterium sp. NIES-54]
MDAFPEELLTPPVPLVALLGAPELHVAIAQHLQAQSPPVASVFVPDRADAAEVSGKERRPADAKCAPPLGVVKAEWVKKHRERIPAAAVVLVEKSLLCGDAGAWQSVCAEIDQIKSALRGRNVKLVLLLVQASAGGEMSEERLGMLKRRAEVDGRSCIPFLVADAEDQKRSLSRLYAVVVELCANYYRDEVRRMRLKIERRAYSHTELTVRYYFKTTSRCVRAHGAGTMHQAVGSGQPGVLFALPDFTLSHALVLPFKPSGWFPCTLPRCTPWSIGALPLANRPGSQGSRGGTQPQGLHAPAALRLLSQLKRHPHLPSPSIPAQLFSGASERYPLQTVLEVKAVAEVLSLKVCTLLLHSGREVEAVGWFRTFMEWFRARVGPPEAAFLHWGWMARQYEVFGELLQQRLASSGHVVGTPAGAALAVGSAAAAAAAPVVGGGGAAAAAAAAAVAVATSATAAATAAATTAAVTATATPLPPALEGQGPFSSQSLRVPLVARVFQLAAKHMLRHRRAYDDARLALDTFGLAALGGDGGGVGGVQVGAFGAVGVSVDGLVDVLAEGNSGVEEPVYVGQACRLVFRGQAPHEQRPQAAGLVPFWVFEAPSPSPFADSSLSVLGQKAVEIADEAPLADVTVDCAADGGLVGEALPVRVWVRSLGHALWSASLSLVLSAAAAAAGAAGGNAAAGAGAGASGSTSTSPLAASSPPASPAAWPTAHAPSNNPSSTTTTATSSSTTSTTNSATGSGGTGKEGPGASHSIPSIAHLPAFEPPPLPGYLPIPPAGTSAGDAFAVLGEGTAGRDEGGETEVHGTAVPAEILLPWGEQGGWAGQGAGQGLVDGETRGEVGEGDEGGNRIERRESSEQQQQQQQQLVALRGDIKVPMVEPHGSWSTVVFVRWKAAIPLSFIATLSYSSSPPAPAAAASTQATQAEGSVREEPAAAVPADANAGADVGEAGECASEGATADPAAAAAGAAAAGGGTAGAAEGVVSSESAASSSSATAKAPFQVSRSQDLRCQEALSVLHRYIGPFRKDSLIPIFQFSPAASSTPTTTSAASTPTTPLPPSTPSSLSALTTAGAAGAGAAPAAAVAVHETCVVAVVVRNTACTALRLLAVRVQQLQGDDSACLVQPVSMHGSTSAALAAAGRAVSHADDGRDGDSSSAGAEGSGEGEVPMPSESLEQSEACDSELPLVLGQGESFTQLFHVTPRVASPALVIGSLLLTWQRHTAQGESSNWLLSQSVLQVPAGMASENYPASGLSVKLAGSDPVALTLDTAAPPDQPHQQAAQTLTPAPLFLPQLSPTVSSLRPFPPVLAANPILVASLRLPPFTIVGSPFSFSIRLSNCTTSLQEVVYQLQDAPGFVFAGQHSGSVTVLPRASLRISFRLVAVASGMLQLPLIRLLAPRPAAKLYPCLHTSRLFVFPSAAAVPAAAAAAAAAADAGAGSKRGMVDALLLQQS